MYIFLDSNLWVVFLINVKIDCLNISVYIEIINVKNVFKKNEEIFLVNVFNENNVCVYWFKKCFGDKFLRILFKYFLIVVVFKIFLFFKFIINWIMWL